MRRSCRSRIGEWVRCTACDAKLQRDVGLKILPDAMARDVHRMARFDYGARFRFSFTMIHDPAGLVSVASWHTKIVNPGLEFSARLSDLGKTNL